MLTARRLIVGFAVATLAVGGCRDKDVPPSPKPTAESPASAPPTKRVVGPLSEADAQALATMNDALKTYVELHKRIEGELPKLPDEATPQQIDSNQRLLEKKLREARKGAKPGELFTPQARPVIKQLIDNVFSGEIGKQLMASIMDEYPVGVKLGVNARYPDSVPVSTVPPEILQTLPKLPEDMEYRFVGRHMILLDTHAHIIADLIENALPPA